MLFLAEFDPKFNGFFPLPFPIYTESLITIVVILLTNEVINMRPKTIPRRLLPRRNAEHLALHVLQTFRLIAMSVLESLQENEKSVFREKLQQIPTNPDQIWYTCTGQRWANFGSDRPSGQKWEGKFGTRFSFLSRELKAGSSPSQFPNSSIFTRWSREEIRNQKLIRVSSLDERRERKLSDAKPSTTVLGYFLCNIHLFRPIIWHSK